MGVDVVIVGGGSAGAVLAARLSEDPRRTVLVLEAGQAGPLDTVADQLSNVDFALTGRDWGMHAFARADRQLDYPQGRFVGGGSSVNGALAFRGAPADYDGWAAAGNPSWSWDQLLPCFRRLEADVDLGATDPLHGADGPVPIRRWSDEELVPVQRAFRDACLADGLPWTDDHNHPSSTGVGAFPMNRDRGRRMSTALTYLRPALDRPNLTVRGDAPVTQVRIERGRATGVTVRAAGTGATEEVGAGEVVLAAGSIHTPAILWRSGIGPASELAGLGIEVVVPNDAVGANLVDHPGVFLFFAPGERVTAAPEPQFQLGARYTSAGADPTDPAACNDMFLSMMNHWDLTGSPDFQAHLGVPSVVVLTCGVHQPRSRGRVALTSADPADQPRIDLNLLDDDADVARLVDGVRRAWRAASTPGMRAFLGRVLLLDEGAFAEDDDDATEALAGYVRSVVAPWYHPVGTCRMGPADAGGTVVGDDLRVHGVEGLRVVDASVMPTIPRAPTNLTAIAIAERAAELMAARD